MDGIKKINFVNCKFLFRSDQMSISNDSENFNVIEPLVVGSLNVENCENYSNRRIGT